jgi:hypothetical protein
VPFETPCQNVFPHELWIAFVFFTDEVDGGFRQIPIVWIDGSQEGMSVRGSKELELMRQGDYDSWLAVQAVQLSSDADLASLKASEIKTKETSSKNTPSVRSGRKKIDKAALINASTPPRSISPPSPASESDPEEFKYSKTPEKKNSKRNQLLETEKAEDKARAFARKRARAQEDAEDKIFNTERSRKRNEDEATYREQVAARNRQPPSGFLPPSPPSGFLPPSPPIRAFPPQLPTDPVRSKRVAHGQTQSTPPPDRNHVRSSYENERVRRKKLELKLQATEAKLQRAEEDSAKRSRLERQLMEERRRTHLTWPEVLYMYVHNFDFCAGREGQSAGL